MTRELRRDSGMADATREIGLCPCGCIGKRRKGRFVEKTIGGAARTCSGTPCSPTTWQPQRGLLQRIDPRVKIVSLLGLLVTGAFLRHDSRCSWRCTR